MEQKQHRKTEGKGKESRRSWSRRKRRSREEEVVGVGKRKKEDEDHLSKRLLLAMHAGDYQLVYTYSDTHMRTIDHHRWRNV